MADLKMSNEGYCVHYHSYNFTQGCSYFLLGDLFFAL